MGLFAIDIEIAKPGRKARWLKLPKVIVDSGSELTWLPENVLREMRVDVFRKDQVFIMANGEQITRDVGIALLRSGDFKTVDEVVFARPGDLLLLGARTLEGFNALVDPRKKRLVAGGPIPAASCNAQWCHRYPIVALGLKRLALPVGRRLF
jgi:predicted aspartyl protease